MLNCPGQKSLLLHELEFVSGELLIKVYLKESRKAGDI